MAYLKNLATETTTRTLQIVEAIARLFGLLPPLPVDSVPTISKSIGTASRDYSTITAFEADLDNTTPYDAGDDVVGECYDDSAFDESVTLNGGGTLGLASVKLSVAAGERHDGTAGTGARMVCSVARTLSIATFGAVTCEWLEWDNNGFSGNPTSISPAVDGATLRKFIIHDATSSGQNNLHGINISQAANLHDCLIYDIGNATSTAAACNGVRCGGQAADAVLIQNCTVDRVAITNALSAGNASGFIEGSGVSTLQNNLSGTPSVAGAGAALCYSGTWNTEDHNAATDTSAGGTGSIDSVTMADEVVSVVDGSEDYHLKTGAACIDAGTDLVTTPTGVNFDIDNRDRDAEGDVWDIGADEFVSAAAAAGLLLLHGLFVGVGA